MLGIFKKLSWFEWLGLAALILVVYLVQHLMHKYGELNVELAKEQTRHQQTRDILQEEKRSAAISDNVVFTYTFERELKLSETPAHQRQNLVEYFTVRDQPTQQEQQHDPVIPVVTTPRPASVPKPEVVYRDRSPDPAAVAVLARGMHDTYCRAYPRGNPCAAQDAAH